MSEPRRRTDVELDKTNFGDDESVGPRVAGLLRMGMVGRQRVVDRLLDRLSLADGGAWFGRMLSMMGEAEGSIDLARIPDGAATFEELDREKRRAKRILSSALAEDDRLRGTLLYFVAVAGALALHRRRMSSQPDEALEPVLLDLAEVGPEAWRHIFRDAARVLEEGAAS
jgi:hypothetical protein